MFSGGASRRRKALANSRTLPKTEQISERYRDLDAWSPGAALDVLWEAQLSAVAAVRAALPEIESAVAAALPLLRSRGRLVYAGAGTSGRIAAQDGAELPPTFDWPRERLVTLMAGGEAAFTGAVEDAEDDAAAGLAAILQHDVGQGDVVIGVAASGGTPFTLAAVQEAARRGALTIGIANSPGSKLLTVAAYPVLVDTGAEPIAGSTRMKAGTAQKVVLNLFSTLLMLRLGRIHQGLMVDMRASNEKLRGRAMRMLQRLTNCDANAASLALENAGGNVKTAVLLLHGLDVAAARSLLSLHQGHLRAALMEIEK
jgi:N-acetylmuramic acid 6-phosphate etherase